jgi:hypothetical protein
LIAADRPRNLAVITVALTFGFCGGVRAWMMGPMWLDQSFIPLQYADRLSRGHGLQLPGQEVAIEAFTNPVWVALMGALGSLNLHEAEIQAPVGLLLYGLLIAVCVRAIWARHACWMAMLPVGLLGLAPVVAAARDGGDVMWLALWSVVAALGVGAELESDEPRKGTKVALLVLSLSGVFGAAVALGLSAMGVRIQRRNNLLLVASALLGLTALRWTFFGTWLPPLYIAPEDGLEALRLMPVCAGLGVVGIVMGWSRGPQTGALAWVVVVGAVYAYMTGQTQLGFGCALIPAMGAVIVLASNVLAAHRSPLWGLLLVLVAAAVDVQQTEQRVSDVAHARMSDFLQSRGMGRFILWRFEPEERVVVHKPGAVPYYCRRGVFDLSGRLQGHSVSPAFALEQEPEAILPDRKIVSNQAQRLYMTQPWPSRLEERYKQYAIQHQKPWKMVDANPVWFHIYIRRDLPMLRTDAPKSNGNILPPADPFGTQEAAP